MLGVVGVVGALAACSGSGSVDDLGAGEVAAPDADTADSVDADAPSEVDTPEIGDGSAVDSCQDVACSDHGTCVVVAGRVTCQCDPDYTATVGLACIDTQTVPCVAAPPRDAISVPAGVDVRYTDRAGWSEPATCGWRCNGGFARVEDRCVPLATLPRWCVDFCDAQRELCPGGGSSPTDCQAVCAPGLASGPDCVGSCLASLDEPAAAPQIICGGVGRKIESLRCPDFGSCAQPVPSTGCDALCDAVDGCGLLSDPQMLFGASHGECVLYCESMAAALAPDGRFGLLRDCATQAMAACDPVHLLACTLDGVAELSANLCTTYSEDCGYIPGTWPDVAACEAALASWDGGQRLAVAGCLGFLGAYHLCAERDCGSPPPTVPPNALAAAKEITSACPDLFIMPLELDYVIEFYGWLVTAVLKAAGHSVNVDVSAVSACIHGAPCPKLRDATLMCVLTAPEE